MNLISFVCDKRWAGSQGIGRFCYEVFSDESMKSFDKIEGPLSSVFDVLDPLRLPFKFFLSGKYFVSPGYNCPILGHAKSIITIHDLMHINFPEYSSLKNRIYYRFLVRSVCKKSPLVFTVSEFTKNEICEWAGIHPEKIVVVPNGVDVSFNDEVEPYKHTKSYVFYIGDKKLHKNIERMLEAYASSVIAKTHDFLISGNINDQILTWAANYGVRENVVFTGFIPEELLPSYYKGADALMFASLYEGFGLPIVEAMAVGTPVLTSNITAMPEVAGGAALLVNPYSVEDIRGGIDTIVRDLQLRSSLSQRGLERVKMFSWDHSREVWSKSLMSIVDGSANL